jgi:hypothetical protein
VVCDLEIGMIEYEEEKEGKRPQRADCCTDV